MWEKTTPPATSPTRGSEALPNGTALARSGGWGLFPGVRDDLRQQPLFDPPPPGRDRAQVRPHTGRATDAFQFVGEAIFPTKNEIGTTQSKITSNSRKACATPIRPKPTAIVWIVGM